MHARTHRASRGIHTNQDRLGDRDHNTGEQVEQIGYRPYGALEEFPKRRCE